MESPQLINFDQFQIDSVYHYFIIALAVFYSYILDGNPDCAKLCSQRVSGHRSVTVSFLITVRVSAETHDLHLVLVARKWMISAGKTVQ